MVSGVKAGWGLLGWDKLLLEPAAKRGLNPWALLAALNLQSRVPGFCRGSSSSGHTVG